jgi:hypothetical protein
LDILEGLKVKPVVILSVLAVIVTCLALFLPIYLIVFSRQQIAPAQRSSEEGYTAFSIPPPPDARAVMVETVEEASKLLNAEVPVRLPTRIPEGLKYVKLMVLKGEAFYAFYSDKPMVETDNPFILMFTQEGWVFNDVTGEPPKLTLIVMKLDPEMAPKITEDSVRKYAEEHNLTFTMIGDVLAYGYEPKELPFWSQPIGALTFYKGDLCYMISSHLPLEEMVKIAESIIEQY